MENELLIIAAIVLVMILIFGLINYTSITLMVIFFIVFIVLAGPLIVFMFGA